MAHRVLVRSQVQGASARKGRHFNSLGALLVLLAPLKNTPFALGGWEFLGVRRKNGRYRLLLGKAAGFDAKPGLT